jgi:ribonucleoside-diphosphate reductase alpha chain
VVKFIDSKIGSGALKNANISVRSKRTTDFIKAVKEDGDWELSWKGKYKSKIKARDLWNKIVQNAWDNAEPGFLNMELALSESTIYYIEELVTTNPCGEIFLTKYGNCCLGHLVLPRFIVDGEVDWHAVGEVTRTGVRFLDNVLDVNQYPLPEMKAASQKLRRIGLGCTGLADMLAMLGIKYGSEEGNKFIEKLYRFISKAAYEASVMLAVEKGAFHACKPDLHVRSGFVSRMTNKIKALIREHGIRNCALLTQAPTGTVSILCDNCSSGVEPMFSYAYWRHFWKGEVRASELCFHPLFEQFLNEGKDVSHFVATNNVTMREHMEVQAIIQRHMDNAVSKTINFPEHHSVEDMAAAWLEYLPRLKGTTFYREGSRKMIMPDGSEAPPPLTAIDYKEALALFQANAARKAEAAETTDCPSGICSI